MFKVIWPLGLAAALAGCGSATAGEGEAATETPVTLRSGAWLIEGSEAFARSKILRHEEACIDDGNKSAITPLIVVGLLRKDIEQTAMTCASPKQERTGNLMIGQLSCAHPERGTLTVKARGVISAERIEVRYDFDLSKFQLTPHEREKAEAEQAASPAILTARRTGSCEAGASMREI